MKFTFCTILFLGSLVVFERDPYYQDYRSDDFIEPEEIFILGTCHLSSRSASSAERVVKTIHPDSVILELCRSRVSVLYEESENQNNASTTSSPFSLSGESFQEALLRSVKLGGGFVVVLRALLTSMTHRISTNFEMKTGVEMRAAYQSAESIDAQVVLGKTALFLPEVLWFGLGDRPIEITLKRGWEAMGLWRGIRLLSLLCSGLMISDSIIAEKSEEFKAKMDGVDEDSLADWTEELTRNFPELATSLVHERDLYLSWSLKRSKAVNGAKKVVGVVGKAHLKGIYYALQNERGKLKFRDLVGDNTSNSSSLEAQLKHFVVEMIIFSLVFSFIYQIWPFLPPHLSLGI